MRDASPAPILRPAFLLALLAAGCGRGDGPDKLVPVRGKITLDGQPLTSGSVSFRPDDSRGNTSQDQPYAILDEQGHYELKTAKWAGAPPGWYKVMVLAPEEPGEWKAGRPPPPRSRINARYARPETTDLAVEVVEKPGPNAYDLQVTR